MSPEISQNQKNNASKLIFGKASEDNLDFLYIKKAKSIGGLNKENIESNTKYQYSYIDMENVINDINEYVIPECQPACKSLWSKNIETFMTSNYEDDILYVLVSELSDDNLQIFKDLKESDNRYYYDEYRHTYGIEVSNRDEIGAEELRSLTDAFILQDIEKRRYMTSDKFLSSFNCKSSIEPDGTIIRRPNPNPQDMDLFEALQFTGKENLYVAEEDRVYESPMYLEWHKRYLDSI